MCDLLLRRSFRATLPPATVQVRPCVFGLSVAVNDRHGGYVLARIWHTRASRAGRLSMRLTGGYKSHVVYGLACFMAGAQEGDGNYECPKT